MVLPLLTPRASGRSSRSGSRSTSAMALAGVARFRCNCFASAARSRRCSAASRSRSRTTTTSACPTSWRRSPDMPAGHGAGDRPDGLGQVDHPGRDHPGHLAQHAAATSSRSRTRSSSCSATTWRPSRSARSAPTPRRSARRSATPCARTPTSSWSARCATARRSATIITAAETGHLVFSTLHTNSAAQTIDRIIDTFAADQQDQVQLAARPGAARGGLDAARPARRRTGPDPGRSRSSSTRRRSRSTSRSDRSRRSTRRSRTSVSYYRMQTMNQSLIALLANGIITYEIAWRGRSIPTISLCSFARCFPKIEDAQREGAMAPSPADFAQIIELMEVKQPLRGAGGALEGADAGEGRAARPARGRARPTLRQDSSSGDVTLVELRNQPSRSRRDATASCRSQRPHRQAQRADQGAQPAARGPGQGARREAAVRILQALS